MSNTSSTWTIIPVLQSVTKTLSLYCTFLVLCPGIVLNTITMLIYMRKRFWRNTKMGFYYSIDAFANNMACCVGLVAFAPAAFGEDLQLVSSTSCQIIVLARSVVIQFPSYYSVLIFFDRTMNIVFRRPIGFFTKYRNIASIIVALWIGVFASNTIQWWRYLKVTTVVTNNRTSYVKGCTGSLETMMITAFVGIPSRIIPTICNTTMNILIIRTLVKSKSRIRRAPTSSSTNTTNTNTISAKELSFAYTLIAQNILFVSCTIWNTVLNMVNIYNYFATVSTNFSTTIVLLQSIGSWGSYLYTSLPFFISLMFNKIFRTELVNIVLRKEKSNTRSSIPGRSQLKVAVSRKKSTNTH